METLWYNPANGTLINDGTFTTDGRNLIVSSPFGADTVFLVRQPLGGPIPQSPTAQFEYGWVPYTVTLDALN